MYQSKPFLKAGLFFGLVAILSSCASLTGFQTGKTVGRNNGEILVSANLSQTPEFDLTENDTTGEVPRLYFPNLEASGRYGITDRIDVGLRVNTNFNFAGDVRFQLIGDQDSPVAVSTGIGFGTFGLLASLWNMQIPLYVSVHPTDKIAVYISPRYINQFHAGDISGHLNYFGGNAGIVFGKKPQIGLDMGLYNLSVKNSDSVPLATFGVGVKFPLGTKDDDVD